VKIRDVLAKVPKESLYPESMPLAELLRFASTRHINGIAKAKSDNAEMYLVFFSGEPEGAICIDDKGTFYGDKATVLIQGNETFALWDVEADLIRALVMRCRIYEKAYIKTSSMYEVPDIGIKSTGIGVLSLTITQKNVPKNGIWVSIREEGMTVGSDITTDTGSVSFRLMYGDYTCIVEDRAHIVSTFPLRFDRTNTRFVHDLEE
jgi:hypothetical protein